jgi:CheY-like chemotaxis protein
VLSNLINNAAKYTEPGGWIEVTAHSSDGQVELSVSDNGIGISAEMLPHVFEMFVQERQPVNEARGGLGLGLAIVQNLMRMHGGTVSARSEGRGTGSTFTIRLPCAASPDGQKDAPPMTAVFSPLARAYRVLIVDNSPDAAEMLALAFNELGCDARVAADGAAALAMVENFQPQIALLEIGLPVINGYELARQLRLRDAGADMRLIALSGYGRKADIELALRSGFDEHLMKPVEFGTLEELLLRAPALWDVTALTSPQIE